MFRRRYFFCDDRFRVFSFFFVKVFLDLVLLFVCFVVFSGYFERGFLRGFREVVRCGRIGLVLGVRFDFVLCCRRVFSGFFGFFGFYFFLKSRRFLFFFVLRLFF